MDDPFDVIFYEYQQLHHTSILKEFKKSPRRERIIVIMILVAGLGALLGLLMQIWLVYVLYIVAIVVVVRIKDVERNKKKRTLLCYRREYIAPLRSCLKRYRLYNSPSINFIINRCKEEAAKETELEKQIRILKKSCSIIWKATLLFVACGIAKAGGMDLEVPQISNAILKFLNAFDIPTAITTCLHGLVILVILASMYYLTCNFIEDKNNKKREEILALANELQFILVDFQNRPKS